MRKESIKKRARKIKTQRNRKKKTQRNIRRRKKLINKTRRGGGPYTKPPSRLGQKPSSLRRVVNSSDIKSPRSKIPIIKPIIGKNSSIRKKPKSINPINPINPIISKTPPQRLFSFKNIDEQEKDYSLEITKLQHQKTTIQKEIVKLNDIIQSNQARIMNPLESNRIKIRDEVASNIAEAYAEIKKMEPVLLHIDKSISYYENTIKKLPQKFATMKSTQKRRKNKSIAESPLGLIRQKQIQQGPGEEGSLKRFASRYLPLSPKIVNTLFGR